jgi:hypothetical protein
MEVSFFIMPSYRGLIGPLQTMGMSTPSLSSMACIRVSFDIAQDYEIFEWRWFEVAYRLVFFEGMRKISMLPIYSFFDHRP